MNPYFEGYLPGGVILVIIALGLAIDIKLNWLNGRERRVREQRGFEVKLNTGDEPVIEKERENDHG